MKTHLTYFAILINIFFTDRFAPCFILSKTFFKFPQLLCIWANATSNQVMKRNGPYLFAGHFKFILTSCDSGWFEFVRNWEFLLLNLITVNSQDFQTRDFHKILWKKESTQKWTCAHCVSKREKDKKKKYCFIHQVYGDASYDIDVDAVRILSTTLCLFSWRSFSI